MTKGTLFVISAPSGAGKTSLVSALSGAVSDLLVSISYTTRPPRQNEKEGQNYFFVSESVFQRDIQKGTFLEYAEVFGHWYGTSRAWVETHLEKGHDVILEIDWQGAQSVRRQMPCVSIFILPPSREILHARLRERRQDSVAIIQTRMAQANAEMAHYAEYDFLVVNDIFEEALTDLKTIVRAERLRVARQASRYSHLVDAMPS